MKRAKVAKYSPVLPWCVGAQILTVPDQTQLNDTTSLEMQEVIAGPDYGIQSYELAKAACYALTGLWRD